MSLMTQLEELRNEEAQLGLRWLELLCQIDGAASMLADNPVADSMESFRALQRRANETGRQRVELQTRIAVLERSRATAHESALSAG